MAGQGFLSKCILIAVDQVNAVYENVERHVIPCDAYTWESVVYIIAHSRGTYEPLIVPLPVDKIHYKNITGTLVVNDQ